MKFSSVVKSIAVVVGTLYVAHLFDGGTCSCGTMITPATAQEASATVETASPAVASTVLPTTETMQTAPVPAGQSASEAGALEVRTASEASAQHPPATGPRPKLVDLGAGKCIPCKKMAPILEEAKKLYEGKADVEFIDVWENKSAGEPYGIRMIPTQIFFDAAGKEVFRHEGFFPMEDIQKQFESMGVALKKE